MQLSVARPRSDFDGAAQPEGIERPIEDTRVEQCCRLRQQGHAAQALQLLADAPPNTTRLQVEAALCAFDVGDAARLRAFVAGNPAAERAVGPLAAVLAGDDPPQARAPLLKGLAAIARSTRLAAEGDLEKARQRLHSVPKNLRQTLNVDAHADVLKMRRGHGNHAYGAAYHFIKRTRDDAEVLKALGLAIGSVPWLAEEVLARRIGLDGRAQKACARSLRYHTAARSDSPAGMLARDPSSIPAEHRGRLHLHRGFAAARSDPARAERELDKALARGEDALEVWRGRALAAHSAEKAHKAFERLLRALERAGSREATLVVALALLDVLLDRGQRAHAWALLEQVDELLEALKIEGAETLRVAGVYRLTLLRDRGDDEAARAAALALVEKVPSAGPGWATLIALEDDAAAVDDLLRRGRAAVEASTGGARKQRDLQILDDAAADFRKEHGVIQTAGQWACAYIAAAASCGAPTEALATARDALEDEHRRAAWLVEVALRAHRSADGFEAWLGSLLASPDIELATGAAEVVGQIDAPAVRKASCALSTDRVLHLASSVRGAAAAQLLLEHANRLSRFEIVRLRLIASASMTPHRSRAAARSLEPDFSLTELIDEGDAYEPPAPTPVDVPEELSFIKLLPPDRQTHYAARLLISADQGPTVEDLAVLRALVQEVKRAAAARGMPHGIPMHIEMLADLPPDLLEGGMRFEDDFDRPFEFSRPRQAPPPSAAQRAKNKARKKRQKQDRQRQRRKKK